MSGNKPSNEAAAIAEQSAAKQAEYVKALQKRVDVLEGLLVEIFHFLAEETRPIFGLNGVGLLFDAVEKRLKKELGDEDGEK